MGTLTELGGQAAVCTKCRLASGRTTVVFGSGAPDADLVFIGEAPGFHEDKQGLPFVGAAGQLLEQLLNGIGLKRDEVYICNVLKCRPPGNRDPMADEIEACTPYLREQIALIDPRVIVSLGNFATQYLLGRKIGITRVRGQKIPLDGRTLIPVLHPAAVLRGGLAGSSMKQTEEDFRTIRATLDALPPKLADIPDPAEQLGLF
ncbi:MAG: uracil-DNA glycosylase [Actinomycetota bacterium]|nr:uracil-DNA glycosylase [Actinomycetota bacterium]